MSHPKRCPYYPTARILIATCICLRSQLILNVVQAASSTKEYTPSKWSNVRYIVIRFVQLCAHASPVRTPRIIPRYMRCG